MCKLLRRKYSFGLVNFLLLIVDVTDCIRSCRLGSEGDNDDDDDDDPVAVVDCMKCICVGNDNIGCGNGDNGVARCMVFAFWHQNTNNMRTGNNMYIRILARLHLRNTCAYMT